MQPGDVQLVPGPLYHNGPYSFSMFDLFVGGTLVVMERFDAAEALRLIEQYRVQWVFFVPTMMHRIWRLPNRERYDVSSLRMVFSTGAPWPIWLKEAWIEWLGPDVIREGYGGTESQGGTSITGHESLERRDRLACRNKARWCASSMPTATRCRPVRSARSTSCPPPARQHLLLPRRRSEGPRGLGDHRRPRLRRRRRLPLSRRPPDRHDRHRWRERVPGRGGGRARCAPGVRSSAVIGLPDDDLGQTVHAILDVPDLDLTMGRGRRFTDELRAASA